MTPSPTAAAAPRAASEPVARPISCLNSFDTRCGDFQWQPPIGPNTPTDVSVTFDPPNPVAGQVVTVTVTWSDREADTGFSSFHASNSCAVTSDGSCFSGGPAHVGLSCPSMHGPWRSPPPLPGRATETHLRKFLVAGMSTWTVEVNVANSAAFTNDRCTADPWAESSQLHNVVTVAPAPTPNTTGPTPTNVLSPQLSPSTTSTTSIASG